MNKMMVGCTFSFIFGALAGAAGMWNYAQKRANIAIEETRKVYANRTPVKIEEEHEEAKSEEKKTDILKLKSITNTYVSPTPVPVSPAASTKPLPNVDYISNVEFGEEIGYDCKELVLDTDTERVMERSADGNFVMVPNADDILGVNWEDHFDAYEDDTCYVRNHDLKVDYCVNKTMPMEHIDDESELD